MAMSREEYLARRSARSKARRLVMTEEDYEKERTRNRNWHHANKEKSAAHNAKYLKSRTPERIAQQKASKHAYYMKNKEHFRGLGRVYRVENKEALQTYRDKNREKSRLYSKKYNAEHQAERIAYDEKNKERRKKQHLEYYAANKEIISQKARARQIVWITANPEAYRQKKEAYKNTLAYARQSLKKGAPSEAVFPDALLEAKLLQLQILRQVSK